MPVLATNGPQFLRYLTSTFTREQIINSPEYCNMLEDPDIKDDVELAFKYDAALKGGYSEKKEFIQYLLCNGPDLDMQTVLYYRDIILNDKEMYNIYRYEFSYDSVALQMDLRENTYNKSTSNSANNKDNCFSDPSSYLGPFNTTVSLGVSKRSWQNPRNVYAQIAKYKEKKTKEEEEKKKNNQQNQSGTTLKPSEMPADQRGLKELTPQAAFGVTALRTAGVVQAADNEKKNDKAVSETIANSCGDAAAINTAEELEDALTLKLFNTTEDARAFYFGKNYSDMDPSKNKKTPLKSTLKYKYPFDLRKRESGMTGPNALGPGGGAGIVYDDADNAMLSSFDVVGSFVTKIGGDLTVNTHNVKGWLYSNVNTNGSGAANTLTGEIMFCGGSGPYGDNTKMICPVISQEGKDESSSVTSSTSSAMHDITSSPNKKRKFVVGVNMNCSTVTDYFTRFFKDSHATEEDFKQLLTNGLVWAKIKVSTGIMTDPMGAVNHSSVAITAPVIGDCSVTGEAGLKFITLDPMLILTNERLNGIYSLNNTNGAKLSSEVKGNMLDDGTFNGYDENMIYNANSGATFNLTAPVEKKMCRIRLYVPQKYKENVKSIIGTRFSTVQISNNASVYFPDDFYSPGDMSDNFVESSANVTAMGPVGGGNGNLGFYITKPVVITPMSYKLPVIPTQTEVFSMRSAYGNVGGGNMVDVPIPPGWPMTSSGKPVSSIKVNGLIADRFAAILKDTFTHYGTDIGIVAPGLCIYDGCLCVRKMTNSDNWSMHAWGIALDFDAGCNEYSTRAPAARLSQPIYGPFWKIVQAHGGQSLGLHSNKDWMHFQFARWGR